MKHYDKGSLMLFILPFLIGLSACAVLRAASQHVLTLDVSFTWPTWARKVLVVLTCSVSSGLSAYFLTTLPLWTAIAVSVFVACLTVLAVIDAQTMLLPDVLTLPLLAMGLLVNLNATLVAFQDALLGATLGCVAPYLINMYYHHCRGQDGIGLGDVKLITALGGWLGWQALPTLAVIASGIHLTLLAIVFIVSRSKDAVREQPFGPALGAAGIVLVI